MKDFREGFVNNSYCSFFRGIGKWQLFHFILSFLADGVGESGKISQRRVKSKGKASNSRDTS